MNVPLPAAAFPIGNKAAGTATFVVAVLVGLSLFLAAKNKPAQQPSSR